MGAWGNYPKDNDGTLDFKSDIDKAINRELEGAIRKYATDTDMKWSLVGLIMIALQQGVFVKVSLVKKSIKWLDDCVKDAKWISEWNDSKEVLESIPTVKVCYLSRR
jgi:hypothetical protein